MENVLLVIHLFLALAIIGLVLLQRSEGGALGIGGEDPQTVVATFNGRQLPTETNLRSAISSIDLATAVFDTPVDVWNGPIQAANGQWIIVRATEDIPGETTPLEDGASRIFRCRRSP